MRSVVEVVLVVLLLVLLVLVLLVVPLLERMVGEAQLLVGMSGTSRLEVPRLVDGGGLGRHDWCAHEGCADGAPCGWVCGCVVCVCVYVCARVCVHHTGE